MSEFDAVEKRLRQKRQQRIASYLTYSIIALLVATIGFVVFIFSTSFFGSKQPQSIAEQQYTLNMAKLKTDPQSVSTLMKIAQAEIEMGKTSDAVNHLKKAIKIRGYAPMLHYTLGQAYWKGGNIKEAIKAYEQELKATQDKNELAAFDLGRIFYEQKKYDRALEYFIMARERMSTAAEVHYYIGQIYETKKDYVNAKASYEQALLYVPDYREAAEAMIRLTQTKGLETPQTGGASSQVQSQPTQQVNPAAGSSR